MEYPGYPEELLEENLLVVLDGTTSLGVSLRSRFGGKGCYVEGFVDDMTIHEDNLRSPSIVGIGDILVSINGDNVQECTVEEVHRKVQSLSFPIRLHFQRNNIPTLNEVAQDLSSIRILCYYSWIKRFIKKMSSDTNANLDYHSILAMWSRLFQVTIWLQTVFVEEHISTPCTQEHLNRIAHALIIVFPYAATDNVALQEYYAFLRNTMISYLQSATVQDFLNKLIESFIRSDEFRCMMAFNPSFSDWQFISITDLLQSSAGLLTLCSVVPKSALWIQMYSAYHALRDPNSFINEKELALFFSEGESLALEVTITLIEQGILRRIYESDAYFLYLRQVTSSKTGFLRELFPLLPRSFSLHHYEYGKNAITKYTDTCSPSTISNNSTIKLEFNIVFNDLTHAKEFQLIQFSVIDCCDCDNDEDVNSWWQQTLGIEDRSEACDNTKDENSIWLTNRIVRHLCPQLESNLLTSISCKSSSLTMAPVGFVLDQFSKNHSTGSTIPLYVASRVSFCDKLLHSNKVNEILNSLCAVDAGLFDESSALKSPVKIGFSTANCSSEIPSLQNVRHEGSKMMNEMYVLSSRWLQPVRSVMFQVISDKNSPHVDGHSLITSMDIERKLITTKGQCQHLENATTVGKEEKILNDTTATEDKSTMTGMMFAMTTKLWGNFHRSDNNQASSDNNHNKNISILGESSIPVKEKIEMGNNSSELSPADTLLIASDTTSLTTEETITHDDDVSNNTFCDNNTNNTKSDINDNSNSSDKSIDHIITNNNHNDDYSDTIGNKLPTTTIASVTCLISTEPKLRTLRKSLFGLPLLQHNSLDDNQATNKGDDPVNDTNYSKEDEWCFDMITEKIAPGLIFLLFHAFLLEVSVVMVYNEESSPDNTADILPVLLTQWLCRAVAPLQWPHTIAVNAPSEIVLPLLQCPTPVWLALPQSVYKFHVHSMNNSINNNQTAYNNACDNIDGGCSEEKRRLLCQENILVVDLSRQEVYWPSSLYEIISMSTNSFDNSHLQPTLESKETFRKASKKREGYKEYLALFRLAKIIGGNRNNDKNSQIMTSRFAFSPLLDGEVSVGNFPTFFTAWCCCFAPASSSYTSHNRSQDHLYLRETSYSHTYHNDTNDKNCLFDTVTHAIPVAWTTLPDRLLTLNETMKDENDFAGFFSQKMYRLHGLCQLFVQQLLYGMNYLLLDAPIPQPNKKDFGSKVIQEGCLCLDDELFLWVKTQQALVYHSFLSTARERPMCFFAHEYYLRVFLKRWLRSQALSVYLTAKKSP